LWSVSSKRRGREPSPISKHAEEKNDELQRGEKRVKPLLEELGKGKK